MYKEARSMGRKAGLPESTIALVLVSLLLGPGLAAAGTNLLPNATFDADIGSWSINPWIPEANARWSSEDADGDPGSGSAEVDFIGTGGNSTQLGLFVCLPAGPARTFQFGGTAKLKQATVDAVPYIFVDAHSSSSCDDYLAGTNIGFWPPSTDWSTKADSFTTPPGTTHLRFMIGTYKEGGVTETLGSRMDNLLLVEQIEPVEDAVFADRFEAP